MSTDQVCFSDDDRLGVNDGHEEFNDDEASQSEEASDAPAKIDADEIANLRNSDDESEDKDTDQDGQKNCQPVDAQPRAPTSGNNGTDEHRASSGSEHARDRGGQASASGDGKAVEETRGPVRNLPEDCASPATRQQADNPAISGATKGSGERTQKGPHGSIGVYPGDHAALAGWPSVGKFRAACLVGATKSKQNFGLGHVQRFIETSEQHFLYALIAILSKYAKERRKAEFNGIMMRALCSGTATSYGESSASLSFDVADPHSTMPALRSAVERWYADRNLPAPPPKKHEVPALSDQLMERATNCLPFARSDEAGRAKIIASVEATRAREEARQKAMGTAYGKIPAAVRRILAQQCAREIAAEFTTPVAATLVLPFTIDDEKFPLLAHQNIHVLCNQLGNPPSIATLQSEIDARFFGGTGAAAALLDHCALPPVDEADRVGPCDPAQFGCLLMRVIADAHIAAEARAKERGVVIEPKLRGSAFMVLATSVLANQNRDVWPLALRHLCGASVPDEWWPTNFSQHFVAAANGGVSAMRGHREPEKYEEAFRMLVNTPPALDNLHTKKLSDSDRAKVLAEDLKKALHAQKLKKRFDNSNAKKAKAAIPSASESRAPQEKKRKSATPSTAATGPSIAVSKKGTPKSSPQKRRKQTSAASKAETAKAARAFEALRARDKALEALPSNERPPTEASFGPHWTMQTEAELARAPENIQILVEELSAAVPARTVADLARSISVQTVESNTTSAQHAERAMHGGMNLDADEPRADDVPAGTLVSEDYTRVEQIHKRWNTQRREAGLSDIALARVRLEFAYARDPRLGREIQRDCGVPRLSEQLRESLFEVVAVLRAEGKVPTVNRRALALQAGRTPTRVTHHLAMKAAAGNGTPRASCDELGQNATAKSLVLDVAAGVKPLEGAITNYDEVCELRDTLLETGCLHNYQVARISAAMAALPGYVRYVMWRVYSLGTMFEPTADLGDLLSTCRQATREGTGLATYAARCMIMASALDALFKAVTTPSMSVEKLRTLLSPIVDMNEPFSPLMMPGTFLGTNSDRNADMSAKFAPVRAAIMARRTATPAEAKN